MNRPVTIDVFFNVRRSRATVTLVWPGRVFVAEVSKRRAEVLQSCLALQQNSRGRARVLDDFIAEWRA